MTRRRSASRAARGSATRRAVKDMVSQALEVLAAFGLPMDQTARRLERMALAFLAVADVRSAKDWPKAKDVTQGRSLKTRDIINYENDHLAQKISSGSYDDIRRRDLLYLVEAGVVVQTSPASARNDPQRGYALSEAHAPLVRGYGGGGWRDTVDEFMLDKVPLAEALKQPREVALTDVTLPNGKTLGFGPGEHNALIKAVIESFLPRYGNEAQVLYVGDASDKLLHVDEETLKSINFFEIGHGELPDVIALAPSKNWLYLIEAVHSAGPIDAVRRMKLAKLTEKCTAEIIYVTAFADREKLRRWLPDIAWETEVWTAAEPDHLLHFDGDKFLGPYIEK